MAKIKAKAEKNVEILGYQPDAVMQDHMRRAKAFVFAAEEDFGITPVEAQACGTPVIAFGKGGVLETIRPYGETKATGLFYAEQSVTSVIQAVRQFEMIGNSILAQDCRDNAMRFSAERFHRELEEYIKGKWNEFSESKKISY
jgi:glycosyltransferase involved in cell wall biosynthesis